VLTYHNDSGRTGWNPNERVLTTSNVRASSFGLLHTVHLDGRVDAQPLIVTRQPIARGRLHDVAYVATEQNSVYAIDANSGAVLWSRNLGTPVPDSVKDGDDNVYPVVGILGTPVIDRSRGALFVVADSLEGSADTFTLHALALRTGLDVTAPTVVTVSAPLSNGATWTFDPRFQLQRAGLAASAGSVYVPFGSNGDIDYTKARGTIVRYDEGTLARLDAAVTNRLAERREAYYLSSIWQSGYAPAVDPEGNLLLSTGNSNPDRRTYAGSYNHPEGVLKISADLSTLLTSFTPSDYFTLDEDDSDVGSGGTLVVPDQPGKYPHLVVAGGKDGRTFLLDGDDLGGYTKGGPDRVLAEAEEGGCWCGPAYFVGDDAVPRIVTGGSEGVTAWKLVTGEQRPALALDSTTGSAAVEGLPDDGGVIPSISSDGTTAGTAIAWFVRRPQTTSDSEPGTPVTLYAYDAMNLSRQLFFAKAGTWRHAYNSNANLVPTIANGKVYVASEKRLEIFGLH
jgi:outer membrane protein assembly factor BamB